MPMVQKYGGSSLADPEKLRRAAARAVELAHQGRQVVVVVSAQGDTTDRLIQAAGAVTPQPDPRELDALLATGEQISGALLAMAIDRMGQPAVSLTGWQAGLQTDDVPGNARILGLAGDRISRELARGRIVVVAGFQGISPLGDITTLGRGGSDTTAVALAAFLGASACQIFTDVDGVYDRDPRRFPGSNRYDYLCYEDMLRLIENGAQVLHNRSVELARAHGLRLEVLSARTGAPGTIVGP